MSDFPLFGGLAKINAGGVSGSTGTTVSCSVDNTKGSYVQLIDSASALPAASGFVLVTNRDTLAAWDMLADIAVGGAGSEQDIVTNTPLAGALQDTETVFFPIQIAASTRVSMRLQAGNAGATQLVALYLLHGGMISPNGLSGATCLGFNAADSGGTPVTPGNGTYGSYAEIVASTTRVYKGLAIGFATQNSVRSAQTLLVTVGIGAASSEQAIIPDYFAHCETTVPSLSPVFPMHIPSGSRLAVKMSGSITTALDAMLIGFY